MSDVKERFSKLDCNEAYSIAITIEDEGYNFYSKLIENTDDKRVKNELQYLRDEEQKHKELFQNMLKKRGSGMVGCSDEKINTWVEDEVLKPLKDNLPESGKDALKLGKELEKQVVDFLNEIKEAEDDEENRAALDTVIEEEKKHLKKLNIILAY
jgi:rubrerythrin